MKKFIVTGFSKYGVWGKVEVNTILECVPMRAAKKGIIEITNIEEVDISHYLNAPTYHGYTAEFDYYYAQEVEKI